MDDDVICSSPIPMQHGDIAQQLGLYLHGNNIHEIYHSGFHYSTKTVLVKVVNYLPTCLCCLTLMQLLISFIIIIIIDKLEKVVGIRETALPWLRSYLTDCYQFVDANGGFTMHNKVWCSIRFYFRPTALFSISSTSKSNYL